jgi:hypothetical protein
MRERQLKYLLTIITLVFTSITSLATCTAIEKNADYSVENGSSNTVSFTANIDAVGDLVAITAWCYPGCTPVSVVLGRQTAVQTTVSGVVGPGDPATGQGFIFYILSAAASGSQTLTWTVSGSHSGIQTSYIDFSPSAGCSFTHHVDSPLGSCLNNCGNTGNPGVINAPSITPTAGDLLFNFTWSSEHVNDINSPWSCPVYGGSGETGDCQFINTRNVAAYILSAASGSTANNTTDTHDSDTWQALLTSFSMKSSGVLPNPPTGLTAVVQ